MKKHKPALLLMILAFAASCVQAEPTVTNIFQDTYIVDALGDIALQTGIPILAGQSVSGFVTMEFNETPLEEALRQICLPFGYNFRYFDEGYYLVGANDISDPTFMHLSEVAVFKTRYLRAEVVASLLAASFAPFVKVDQKANTLVITASREMVHRISEDIARIDQPVKQVMLEVLVTELSQDAREALGTEWQWARAKGPSQSLAFTTQTLNAALGMKYSEFLLSLKASVDKGQARIHANPRIVTSDGESAEIFLGQEQSFMVLSKPDSGGYVTRQRVIVKTGTTLKFLPQISPEGEIIVKIEPDVSTINGLNQDGFPIVTSRKATSTIRVQNGETFVLGGLIHEFETKKVNKLPLLGDLPFVGRLFRSESTEKNETEVMIMVTPQILD